MISIKPYTDTPKAEFIHGKDEAAAIAYLKEIGVYERVVSTAPFHPTGAMFIIAANSIKQQNK